MKNKLPIVALIFSLSACAHSSDKIGAQYVSPEIYRDWDCSQIAQEQARISTRVAQLKGEVDSNATGDAVATGVGIVLFWPALFFIDGDGPEAAEYGRLKGEYEALQQQATIKKCALPAPAPQTPPQTQPQSQPQQQTKQS